MMTYVRVYKFDCCSRKNVLDFLTNVLKDLHSFIFLGNSFQILVKCQMLYNCVVFYIYVKLNYSSVKSIL